jgi:hypothetical protein
MGNGHGPLNHMHSLLSRALHRPTRNDPYPLVRTLIRSNADVWKQYVQHDFVKQLGQGTLSQKRFIHFLKCATCSLPFSLDGPFTPIHRTGRTISISNITLEQMGTASTD